MDIEKLKHKKLKRLRMRRYEKEHTNDIYKHRTEYKGYEYNYINSVNGIEGLMCPCCYYATTVYTHFKSESKVVVGFEEDDKDNLPLIETRQSFEYILDECPNCKYTYVHMIPIDYEILYAIVTLNKKGFRTKFCCAGHFPKKKSLISQSYIYFADRKILEYLHTLPLYWFIDYKELKRYDRIIIRAEYYSSYNHIYELNEWVDTLPNLY